MKKMTITALLLSSALLVACGGKTDSVKSAPEDKATPTTEKPAEASTKDLLVGSWVQAIPGNEKEMQGFTLNADGSAASINMATLVYTKWKRLSDKEVSLTAKSIGNGTSSVDEDVYVIKQLDQDKLKLVIKGGEMEDIYSRKK